MATSSSTKLLGAVLMAIWMFTLPVLAQTQPIERARQLERQNNQRNQQSDAPSENRERSVEEREQVCARRQQRVEARLKRIEVILDKQAGLLNKVLERLDEFIEEKDLTVTDYPELKVEVVNAKTVAADSLADFLGDPPRLDCNQEDNRAEIYPHQDEAKIATEALKNYHQALRRLIVAVKQAAETNPSLGIQS